LHTLLIILQVSSTHIIEWDNNLLRLVLGNERERAAISSYKIHHDNR
jgi:hypothetical protein